MISSLRLQNFRSYQDDSFEFDAGVNIVVGPNASGKTNILEALLFVCRGSSYRARDNEVIRFNAPWARLDALTLQHERVIKLERGHNESITKTLVIDGHGYKRFTVEKTLPVVVFEPEHLLLLTGSPELRRTFIDDLLEQTVPGFGETRRHYKRTLAQRNALLKTGQRQDHFFAWNIRLSELGGRIAQQRIKLLDRFNEQLSAMYSDIAHSKSAVTLAYKSTCAAKDYGSQMLRKLEENIDADYGRGFTAYGPHRDDIVPYLADHPVQDTASRGEIRSLLLAIKILELQLLERARAQTPLLLLDDVFSELDGARRQALTRFLQPYQTFITTTDADVVIKSLLTTSHVIPLSRD